MHMHRVLFYLVGFAVLSLLQRIVGFHGPGIERTPFERTVVFLLTIIAAAALSAVLIKER